MTSTLFIHILAGAIGLVSGYLALWSPKGMPFHRKAGIVFVWSMLAMCALGGSIAVVRGTAPAINVPAALVTASLVVTALTTVRPRSATTRRVDLAAMVVLLAVGIASVAIGVDAIAEGGKRAGLAFPMFLFGAAGLIAGGGDLRVLRSGPLTGSRRIARHLWRMSFALFIAALSFFLGQADELPEVLRIPGLLALPVLAVLVTMLYWLWRVRRRRVPTRLVDPPPAGPALI